MLTTAKLSTLLLSFVLPAIACGQGFEDQEFSNYLDSLASTPPPLQQTLRDHEFRLKELEDRASADNNATPDEVCREIAMLRSTIAHACALGAKSSVLNELLERTDECTPRSGIYMYWLGTAQFHAKLFEDAVRRFELAAKVTPPEVPVSVNIQFNLAASLHELMRYPESIAVLRALISPESPWTNNPQFTDPRSRQTLEINMAAMLISAGADEDALNLLSEIDRDLIDAYWRVILWLNEIQARNNLGRYVEADSIWSGYIETIPIQEVPVVGWPILVECMLSSASFDAMLDLRNRFQGVPKELSENLYLNALLDPTLTEDNLRRMWDFFEESLRLERKQEMKEAKRRSLVANSAMQREIDQLKQGVKLAEFQSQTWQQTALVFLAIVLLLVSVAFSHQWKKRRVIARALEETLETKEDANSPPLVKNLLSTDEIRTLHDGLTKGRRVGEAIMVLRRLEASQDSEMDFVLAENQPHIEGWEQLNLKEKDIIRMTLNDEVPKEMAHKLGVSVGYIYNSRSAIRRKLEIPEDALFKFWILQELKRSAKSAASDEIA